MYTATEVWTAGGFCAILQDMKTEAKKRCDQRWEAKAYDRILLRVRKDTHPTRDEITEAAAAAGMSLNAYCLEAILEKMNGNPGGDPGNQGSDPGDDLERIPFYD